MITKSEWQAVNRELMAEDRRRLGEPPAVEEVLAYARGELSPEDEARVRERLLCYPELVRALTVPFPTEGAEPGHPDYLPDEEFMRHWAAIRKRMHARQRDARRVLRCWRASTALAAALALALGALLWQATAKLREPHAVWEEQVLLPDGRRGSIGEPVTLTARGDSILLVMPLIGPRNFTSYRLELVDASAGRVRWSSRALAPANEDALAILVRRSFLQPGAYQIVLYGQGPGEQRLGSYSLNVPTQ